MTNVSTLTLLAMAHNIGRAQSVPANGSPEIVLRTSSSLCRDEIGSGEIPSSGTLRWNRPFFALLELDVKPRVVVFGSVAAVTNAIAAETSRAVIGKPETGMVIEPDTSKASNVRLLAGVTVAKEA